MARVKLDKTGNVFTLTMDAGENRWNTALVDELMAALDEVEGCDGAAALVTTVRARSFTLMVLTSTGVMHPLITLKPVIQIPFSLWSSWRG